MTTSSRRAAVADAAGFFVFRDRGVPYLSGSAPDAPVLDDVALVVGLASSANARVRHALAAWMLAQPEAHPAVLEASPTLDHSLEPLNMKDDAHLLMDPATGSRRRSAQPSSQVARVMPRTATGCR